MKLKVPDTSTRECGNWCPTEDQNPASYLLDLAIQNQFLGFFNAKSSDALYEAHLSLLHPW